MSRLSEPPEHYKAGWIDQLDQRRGIAQVMRDKYTALTNDLGGADRLSYQRLLLVERVLWLDYWLAQQERSLAEGKEFDVGKWTQAVNSLQGVLTKLGLDRVAHDVGSLQEYIRAKQ